MVAAAVCVIGLGGCGSATAVSGGSDINGGLIPISTAGTYSYAITNTAEGVDQFALVPVTGTGGYPFPTTAGGSIYLATGNYRGECGRSGAGVVDCGTWSITLTLNTP